MTQFEKIKVMTVEEMAEIIYSCVINDGSLCNYCPEIDNLICYGSYCDKKSGKEIIVEWIGREEKE